MGRLAYGIMMIVILQLALVLFAGQDIPFTGIVSFVTGLFDWSDLPLYAEILRLLGIGLLGTAGVIAGLYLVRNEWILYAALAGVFFTYGATIVSLWQYIASQSFFGDPTSAQVIATFSCLSLSVFFLFVTLDFSRGKD